MIRIEHLQKYYNKGQSNEQHVLNDVSLELGETGLVCILGESGSGKTTLLNTVGGLDDFSGGSIHIDDVTVTKYDPDIIEPVRNEHFGYIFQNYYLLQDFSVAYNVKLALSRYDLTEEEQEKRVDYVLDMLGMAKFKKKQVSKLSGGQQQRVSIARALVKAPDVIFADEPTGNLDEENTLRTMSILKSISKSCLVLLVTHEKRIARFFGDRIIEVGDGRIISDYKNTSDDPLNRIDDANFYLREMECANLQSNYADFKIYYEEGDKPPQIRLGLAWRDGRLYVQNLMDDCDVLLEGAAGGVQMIDDKRPTLELSDVENTSFELPALKGDRPASLSRREIWNMAVRNMRQMGKRQAFMLVILVVTGVLLSITAAQIVNSASVDEESIVSSDSHVIHLRFNQVSSLWGDDQKEKIVEFYRQYLKAGELGDVFYRSDAGIYLQGQGITQMKNILQKVRSFSFENISHVKEEQLLYGKLPATRNEAVVDIRVIHNLQESRGVLSTMYGDPESYVGARFYAPVSGQYLTITGICETGETDIYVSQNLMIGIENTGQRIESVSELQNRRPGEFEDLHLADDEIMIRRRFMEALNAGKSDEEAYKIGGTYQIGELKEHTYKIAGTFDDDEKQQVNYVLSDKGCIDMLELALYENRECDVYTNHIADDLEKLKAFGKDNTLYFQLELTTPYEDEIAAYRKAHTIDPGVRGLITAVIAVVSLIMVYFTMKSNAQSRSEELTVYRLIGISGGSIRRAYMLEMALLTCFTSLPAVLVTAGVIKFIGGIPSLQMNLLFPWWTVLLLLAVIYALHMVISILPVTGILSKPPATLAVKE